MSTIARFSIEEYDRMIAAGVFSGRRYRRVELIRGEVREMLPIGPPHESAVDFLTRWSASVTPADKVRIRVQNSIGLPPLASAPEPDLAWVRERKGYGRSRPKAADVLLVIEVAESSLDYDRGEKAELYAASRIQDYWVVNLIDECVDDFREPHRGRYRKVQTFVAGQRVHPLALPKAVLSVSDVFAF
jgi:Uma2 family endonuclease